MLSSYGDMAAAMGGGLGMGMGIDRYSRHRYKQKQVSQPDHGVRGVNQSSGAASSRKKKSKHEYGSHKDFKQTVPKARTMNKDSNGHEEATSSESDYLAMPTLMDLDYEETGLSGIENLGNTCYLNSAIQCLSHTRPLTEYLVTGSYRDLLPDRIDSESVDLLVNYIILLCGLWEENCVVAPNTFHQVFGAYFPEYSPLSQNDSHESIAFMVDQFHEALKYKITIPALPPVFNKTDYIRNRALKQWHQHFQDPIKNKDKNVTFHSKIIEIFTGQEHSRLQCRSCQRVCHIFPPFNDLTLPIHKYTDSNNRVPELTQLLEWFCQKEELDVKNQWKCDKCGEKTSAHKKITFWKLPPILVITLKRFTLQQMGGVYSFTRKNSQFVRYPVTDLDLSEYVTNPDAQQTRYELFGVSCHRGSKNFGHYYTLCLNGDGHWYKYDDERVDPINPKDIVNPHAYVLFYRRKTNHYSQLIQQ